MELNSAVEVEVEVEVVIRSQPTGYPQCSAFLFSGLDRQNTLLSIPNHGGHTKAKLAPT